MNQESDANLKIPPAANHPQSIPFRHPEKDGFQDHDCPPGDVPVESRMSFKLLP